MKVGFEKWGFGERLAEFEGRRRWGLREEVRRESG